eukprot:8926167-Pyramimonas_sp.AAC.1
MNTDIVAVRSTGEKATPDRSASAPDLKCPFVLRCGYLAGSHVTMSCGTAHLPRKRVLKRRTVVDVRT